VAALKERGLRVTPQRVELVRLIASSEGHPSAAQLHARIQRQFPTMSQATVYKTLALLKEIGQALEIDLRDDSHYDGNRPQPHPHLICTQCKAIRDVEADLEASTIRRLARSSGYANIRSQVSFYGLCPACRQGRH
jgi:Fur family peroxide stress response transcriptional regulator